MKTHQLITYRLRSGLTLFLMLAAFAAVTSCSKEDTEMPYSEEPSLMEVFAMGTEDGTSAKPANAPGDDPIATIAGNAGFNILVAALDYVDTKEGTNLVGLFSTGTDQYTVFAPTDEAFVNAFSALEILEAGADLDETIALTIENGEEKFENFSGIILSVLYYHVTEGRRASNSVLGKKNPKTIETLLEGATFTVDNMGMIQAVGNTAQIDVAGGKFDLTASNGIIHVIDAVILPVDPADLPLKE